MLTRFYKRLWLFVAIVAALVAFVGLASHSDGAVLASPAIAITEYPLNPGAGYTIGIIRGPDNNVWFRELLSDGGSWNRRAIARITPSGMITDFPIPGGPTRIAAGADGNIWYTQANVGAIGKMALTGTVVTYTLPAGISGTNGITAGLDGNLWVTDYSGNQILRVTTGGVVTGQFPVATPASGPYDIIASSDGNLWFIEITANQIGRITPDGTISEFKLPTADAIIHGITAGPDGAIWIAEGRPFPIAGQFGRIAPNGTITEYPLRGYGLPTAITAGSDGNLWATTVVYPKMDGWVITRITPYGFITHVSDVFYNCSCGSITSGGDGRIWFTSFFSIGAFDPRGVPPPSVFYFPFVAR